MSTQNDDAKRNLAQNLKRARGSMSQAEFSRRIGLPSQQGYQRYESGERLPNGVILAGVASALGVKIESLITDPDAVKGPLGSIAALPTPSRVRETSAVYSTSGSDNFKSASNEELVRSLAELSSQAEKATAVTRRVLLRSILAVASELDRREG